MNDRSYLGWLDHDPAERQRTQRILALFREKESRDELGFGAVRDSIADTLFPGTNTIETRLRYVLFIPWIYRRLEDQRVPAAEVAARARQAQIGLIGPLLDEEASGVFGRVAKGRLLRLPSEVYWSTLVAWGVFRGNQSMDAYHRAFDGLAGRTRVRRRELDDGDHRPPVTWDPGLPEPPSDFPERANFALSPAEADYLRDRVAQSFPDSLLNHLVHDLGTNPLEVDTPWMHPSYAAFSEVHREQLRHAHLFAEVTYGAAILYNLSLAELASNDALRAELEEEMRTWVEGLAALDGVVEWNLDRLLHLFAGTTHVVSQKTREFVRTWYGLAHRRELTTVTGPEARELVRRREISLKGSRSRYMNARARDQWSGAAGLYRQDYRWRTVRRFLADLQGVQ